MRVAIVGGGAAGLSTALHLAPLVSQGYISGPIDVFEADSRRGRDVGVGIWSTALDPFENSDHDSHQLVYNDMVRHGTYIRGVGYRTPKGHWLAKSTLDDSLPGLLFLREVDLISSLRKAVHLEELRGTVNLHSGKGFQISSIYEKSTDPWAAPLVLKNNEQSTPRDYHLIIAADGMNSGLRKMYGGHIYKRHHLTGTEALPGPLDLPNNTPRHDWDVMGQAEATGTQDRNYTVFRGNANMSTEETDLGVSFQTWGERHSMRFATVPMYYPDPKAPGKRCERQVWFATTNDQAIAAEKDPAVRRDMLLENFKDWHDPVCRLMEATGPDDILMERAMAHKHCMGPVVNFNNVIKKIRNVQSPSSGHGPAIVYMGDAFMCIDPILAQGFTIGMEGAAALAKSIDYSIKAPKRSEFPQLAFDPDALRDELKLRHERRLGRLIHLLRATELVQALGQPTSGTLSGFITRAILRPLMRITPGFIKTPIFNGMLKYSLGVPHGKTKHPEQEPK